MSAIVLQPMSWSALPDVDAVEPLGPKDSNLLDEIRDVFKRHNALNRFGVFLLHNHFPMKDDEYLLETTDEVNRTQTISVRSGATSDQDMLQTMWKFSEDGFNEVTVCVKVCDKNNGHKRVHEKQGK